MCRKILAVLMVFLIIFSVILSGCGGAAETDGEAAETDGEAAETDGESGTLTLDFNDEPQDFSLNSHAAYGPRPNVMGIYGYEEARANIEVSFSSMGVGTYESPNAGGRVRYMNREGRAFLTDDKNHGYKGQYYKVNVTAYGEVGELIEGTFEAHLSSGVGGGEVGTQLSYSTVSGSFSVIRRADK